MSVVHAILTNRVFQGAVSGLGAAAAVDLHAFYAFKKGAEFATYDWGTAALRWAQGALAGATAAAGFTAVG